MIRPLALALLLGASGCGGANALDRTQARGSPRDNEPITAVPVRGSHAVIFDTAGRSFRGELLAVDERYVWLLPADGPRARFPLTAIASIDVRGIGSVGPRALPALFQFARYPQGMPRAAR